MPITQWFLCILLPGVLAVSAIKLEGHSEKCSSEGEVANLPLLNNIPCVTCMCKSGLIQCSKKVCRDDLQQCSVLLQQEDQCCLSCQTCSIYGENRLSSAVWYQRDNSDRCVDHVCRDGIVTRSLRQCHNFCPSDVTQTRDVCGCPSCMGCFHEGETIEEGQTVELNPCTTCQCRDGRMSCLKKVCPVLACDDDRTVIEEGSCCRKCIGQRRVFELHDGHCWFRRKILKNLEPVVLDKCTKCLCKNGTVICDREVCPDTSDCPAADLVVEKGRCCPICATHEPLNCTDHRGRLVQHEHSIMDNCVTCRCSNGSFGCQKVECENRVISCPQGHTLERKPGACCPSCVPEPGTCVVFGDPHYRTFDGRPFNFQGSCNYMLAKDCMGKNFTVIAENNSKQSKRFSWTNSVHLRLIHAAPDNDTVVSLYQHLAATVNGAKVALPYVDGDVIMWMEQQMLKVRTNAGISINWDGASFLEITAATRLRGSLCGLCGNYNGFPRDDFIGGDGMFKFEVDDFAKSWLIGKGDCAKPDHKTRSVKPCSRSNKIKLAAKRKCRIFKSRRFQKCYGQVDPKDYYASCLTDSCECPRHKRCSCESIRAYTSACARQGVTIKWNEKKHCRKSCGRGKVYSTCSSPCKYTCKNYKRLRRSSACRGKCVAGCACKPGYVLKNKRCVRTSKCRRKKAFARRFTGNPLEHFLHTPTVSERRVERTQANATAQEILNR
uniref:BMP-binding endothelial regulator protein n=1 Tax=Phallusia mammillata TaxID=59560 RepID=A0A6F9D7H9_9ASCI|nr:BMP-binding endothelial regulator protein [Phallusia mammillata]